MHHMSLSEIARATGGRIYGGKVVQCRAHAKPNDKRLLVSIGIKDDGGIWTNVHHPDLDPMEEKRRIEAKLGIVWQPKRRSKPAHNTKGGQVSKTPTRYVQQVRRCLSSRPPFEHFALLINEHRRADNSDAGKWRAVEYAEQYGFTLDI